jgi:GntR family transcriptional repressor for pyruvate dehydrogenase complex
MTRGSGCAMLMGPMSHTGLNWESLDSASLSARIVRQVRQALFDGKISSGDFLGSEAALAEQFGVSRMAVRDALRNLEASGVVEIRMGAKGGTWVAQGNLELYSDALAVQLRLIRVGVDEIFDAQIAIEVMAADLAARNALAPDLLRLKALLRQLERVRNHSGEFTDVAMQFHQAVIDASHNRVLVALFKALRFVLQPLYARKTTRETADRAIDAHRKLLDAIIARDPDQARMLIAKRLRHIRATQVELTSSLVAGFLPTPSTAKTTAAKPARARRKRS